MLRRGRDIASMKKIKKISINNSSLENFKRCPYLFYRKNILRQHPPEDLSAASYGTAIHKFIEEVTHDASQDINVLMRRIHAEGKFDAYGKHSFSNFATICRNYAKRYMNEDGVDVFHPAAIGKDGKPMVEVFLETCIDEAEGIYINGTIDRIGQTEGGAIFLFDTKTSSGISYWTKNANQKVHISPQLTHYSYLMRQHGLAPDFAVIDLVSTNPTYPGFDRPRTQRSPERIAQWLAETRYYCKLIKYSIENNLFPRNQGEACMAFGGCSLMKHCMFPLQKEPPYATLPEGRLEIIYG